MGWPNIMNNEHGTIVLIELLNHTNITPTSLSIKISDKIESLTFENFINRKLEPLISFGVVKSQIVDTTRILEVDYSGLISYMKKVIEKNISSVNTWAFNSLIKQDLLKEINLKKFDSISIDDRSMLTVKMFLESMRDIDNNFTIEMILHNIIQMIGLSGDELIKTHKKETKVISKQYVNFISICKKYCQLTLNPLILTRYEMF